MSKCTDSNCPHFGMTSCMFTVINGIWQFTRNLEGKTFVIRTNTTGGQVQQQGGCEMTKQEVLDAMDCINCYQYDEMCNTNRYYRCKPSCKDCVGFDNARATIADFVNLMIDHINDEEESWNSVLRRI